MKRNDKIIAYLSDLLDQNEKIRFEEELKNSEELKAEYENIKKELARIRNKGSAQINEFYINRTLYLIENKIYRRERNIKFAKRFSFVLAAIFSLFVVWQAYLFFSSSKSILVAPQNSIAINLDEDLDLIIDKFIYDDFAYETASLKNDVTISNSLYDYYFKTFDLKDLSEEELKKYDNLYENDLNIVNE